MPRALGEASFSPNWNIWLVRLNQPVLFRLRNGEVGTCSWFPSEEGEGIRVEAALLVPRDMGRSSNTSGWERLLKLGDDEGDEMAIEVREPTKLFRRPESESNLRTPMLPRR